MHQLKYEIWLELAEDWEILFGVSALKKVTISYCITYVKASAFEKNVLFSKFVPLLPLAISVPPA